MGKQITDYLFYRWRYVLGYGFIGISLVVLLIVAGIFIPGGLTSTEMDSVVTSKAISFSLASFDANSVINLPYHLLQRASLDIFGISLLSIKLPSLVLGFLSAFGMLLLLRMWFKQNVAVLTTILVITTGQFLFVAQSGSPSIVYVFCSIWLLVAAMMVSRRAKYSGLWKLFLFGLSAISLYTPLSPYVLVALLSAVMLHPHLRYLVRRLSKLKILAGGVVALVIAAPLIYVTVSHPDLGLRLLGIPMQWPDLAANGVLLLKQYFDFISPNNTVPMTPVYGLGSTILIILGIYRLFTTKYTARSYIISSWIILLSPVLLINPKYTSVTFVPVLLLMAMGINTLLSSWYRLFPRNPYARLAGLVPLAVLIGGMVLSGIDRYAYGYLYSPETRANFSNDLQLVNKQLRQEKGTVTLVVSKREAPFYAVIASYHHDVSVAESLILVPGGTTLVSHEAYPATKQNVVEPYRIITDTTAHNADRFYVYKTEVK
jgi:hypothetical protein